MAKTGEKAVKKAFRISLKNGFTRCYLTYY